MRISRPSPALLLILVVFAGATSPFWMVAGLLAFGAGKEYLGRRPFDAALWRDSAQVYGADPVRIRMMEDLLRREDFRGRSREEIVAFLGEATQTGYFTDYDLVYWLGPEPGVVEIDSEWLVFRLGPDGRVGEYRVVRD